MKVALPDESTEQPAVFVPDSIEYKVEARPELLVVANEATDIGAEVEVTEIFLSEPESGCGFLETTKLTEFEVFSLNLFPRAIEAVTEQVPGLTKVRFPLLSTVQTFVSAEV